MLLESRCGLSVASGNARKRGVLIMVKVLWKPGMRSAPQVIR